MVDVSLAGEEDGAVAVAGVASDELVDLDRMVAVDMQLVNPVAGFALALPGEVS